MTKEATKMNFFNTTNMRAHPAVGAPSLDSLPPEVTERILCHYTNATNWLQIARITNIPNWYFERVVFPGQRLLFEAPRWANLEIYTAQLPSPMLSDKIPCDRLRIKEGTEKGRFNEWTLFATIFAPTE